MCAPSSRWERIPLSISIFGYRGFTILMMLAFDTPYVLASALVNVPFVCRLRHCGCAGRNSRTSKNRISNHRVLDVWRSEFDPTRK
jgi:hypothetical protein